MKKNILIAALLAAAQIQAATFVCFDPDADCSRPYVNLISQSKASLDIAIYDLNYLPIANAVIGQSSKVKVRVIVDKEQSKTKSSLVSMLVKAGIPVKYGKQKGIMHDKFTVIDHFYIETGSYNYTDRATLANHENQIYTNDPDVVNAYSGEFEKMWSAGEDVKK